jgi:hypothetical protein
MAAVDDPWYSPFHDLAEDARVNDEALASSDTQHYRRNFVRSVFALYEATLANLRETVGQLLIVDFEQSGKWRLHELVPLLDEFPRPDRSGKLVLEPNRLPFLQLVAYVLKKYAELVGRKRNFLGEHGWQQFQKALKIRHGLMHPKNGFSVRVSDDELKSVKTSFEWWQCVLRDLRQSHKRMLNRRRKRPPVISIQSLLDDEPVGRKA